MKAESRTWQPNNPAMNRNIFLCAALLIILSALFGFNRKRHTIQTELFFGMKRNSGTAISDTAWQAFADTAILPVFKKGFTVSKAKGTWLDPDDGRVISEDSYEVMSVNVMTPELSQQIDAIRKKYCAAFEQDAVMRVDQRVEVML